MAGSHDKSDWILYKTNNLSEEIAASRDDVVNKTTCPSRILEALEPSTGYTLKLRYHDATNDIWSEQGSKEFTTKSKFNNPIIDPNYPTSGVRFVTGENSHNLNNFINADDIVEPNKFTLKINNEIINPIPKTYNLQPYSTVELLSDSAHFTGILSICGSTSFFIRVGVSEMLEPLPTLYSFNNDTSEFGVVTNFRHFFEGNSFERLPKYFLANNPDMIDTESLFYMCDLIELDEDFFKYQTKLETLNSCFSGNTHLKSVPENILVTCTNLTNVSNLFSGCSSLTPVIRFTAKNITAVYNFARDCAAKGTVYVPRGSVTAQTFKSDSSANVNVIEE